MKTYSLRIGILALFVTTLIGGFGSRGSVMAQAAIFQTNVIDFALSHQQDRIVVVTESGATQVVDLVRGETLTELTADNITTPFSVSWDSSLVKWSSDDTRILTVHDSEIAVWNASTGDLLFELKPQLTMPVADGLEEVASGNFNAAISSDGSLIAVGNRFDAIVSVYEVATGVVVHEFEHQNSLGLVGVWHMVFSPTDDLLGTLGFITPITVWDLISGEKQRDLPGETMAFNSDGSLIATSGGRFRSGVWIWDPTTGELVMETDAALSTQHLVWTKDDKLLFALFSGRRLVSDGYIYVGEAIRGWETVTGQEKYTLGITETFGIGLESDTEDTIIGVGAYHAEGYVLLWNQITNDVYNRQFSPDAATHDYELLTVPIHTFALQTDGSVVYAGLDNEIAVWDTQTGDLSYRIPTDVRVVQIDYSEAENVLLALLETRELLIIPEDELSELPTRP